ncbi:MULTISPECIES: type II secretion system minor pseudopilin GspK [unclassified Sphingomonas]|uniref:type II secretion system minor pseudopilin GspK n=1 Tax=unclassified Sphingomonas TaxID=196159 RepID=UPI000928DFD1|nr:MULTISPECIES: type II secretion system minor pseudopilin GspK [unclassified Sphingomonas]MBN8846821.1 type II secretion system minor pseudopilin GspK [Sphingomonas sp.]OJV33783.1 MAG: type II secretory pathway protein [Sphingomonas sp. 67-36]
MSSERERGAALLTVLLLVAVIAVMAAAGLEKLRLATRLGGNAVALEQARAYAQAAETLATTHITALLRQDASRVTLAGGWSGRPIALPLPEGTAVARVTDGGNCFNLNSLVTHGPDGRYTAYTPAVDQFARLMRLIGVSNGESIAAAAADWIDSDDTPLPGGAEDAAYLGGQPGYRTAGTLMADPSELRAVAGVTAESYAKLRPWICALPRAERSRINVNTLTPEQAPLLAMLLPDGSGMAGARAILMRRPPGGYANRDAIWKPAAQAGISADPLAADQADVTSRWFALRVEVTVRGTTMQERGLIDASALPARLVSRQWGEL